MVSRKTDGLFDVFDTLASNIMLPLGGLLIAIFAAWVMSEESSSSELAMGARTYKAWRFATRFIAPAGVILIFLKAVGLV